MHIHDADRQLPHSSRGFGRHIEADAQVTLRRKAMLEVAAAEAAQAPTATQDTVGAATYKVPATTSAESTYDLAAMRRQKGSLSILTQDGDTVQIRFRSRAGVAVQSTTSETAAGTSSTTTVHAFASGRVQVEVKGELDADELKAIGDLMARVDSLATQFFEGDTQEAFSAAAELGFDSAEIAGYALRMSVKESVRASAQVPSIAPSASTPDSAASASAPSAPVTVATDAPSVEVPAATPPVETVAAEEAPTPEAPVAEAPVAPSPPPNADPLASLQQSLGTFLKQVLEELSSVSGTGRAEFSMHWKLQVLIQAVQTDPAAAASDPAGTQLATASLGDLAAAKA
jgi:hypothetical protein